MKFQFSVPKEKQVRVIVYTDCKNEADDQFALAHHLMTQKFVVTGIVAGHFDNHGKNMRYPDKTTAFESQKEVWKMLDLMGVREQYTCHLGAEEALLDTATPIDSEGARYIIEEAMKADERPLYIACQGSLTDLASAILMEPAICQRMTAIWVGGGAYPAGGMEFNLMQDIHAANVLFSSQMPVWQMPINIYKQFSVTLAELQYKVMKCGPLGEYLFRQMVELNDQLAFIPFWPHGEVWGLGDQASLAPLLQETERQDNYVMIKAPFIDENMGYIPTEKNREIRVYQSVDSRTVLEDFFCKLAINYGE